MCCRVRVFPAPANIAALAAIGLFRQRSSETGWEREIVEEGTSVSIHRHPGYVEITLHPAVNAQSGHEGHRLAASVMFEMAAKIAEKVDGTIEQHATISGCLSERGSVATIGNYPSEPLTFDKVCPGFRRVFLGPDLD